MYEKQLVLAKKCFISMSNYDLTEGTCNKRPKNDFKKIKNDSKPIKKR